MALVDITENVERFVLALQSAFQARSMYSADHRLAKSALDDAYSSLQGAIFARQEITLGIIGDRLVFDRRPLPNVGKTAGSLTTLLVQGKVEKATFHRAATRDELGIFLDAIEARRKKDSGAVANVDTSGLRNIVIDGIGYEHSESDSKPEDAGANACTADYAEGVETLDDIARKLADDGTIDAARANAFVSKILGRLLENKSSLLFGAALKRHDEYSFVHSVNVAVIALAQAQGLGLSASLLADVGMAGFLHDAGKLALAGQVLRKKEKLDEAEFAKVKSHPSDGAKLLMMTPGVHPMIAVAAFEHHLRYDKTGYPRKIFGGDLNLGSMIVAIADVYDALRSQRSYKVGMAPEKVYEEMNKMSGTHFQPDLLNAFFATVGVFPPGTLVQLDDDNVAIVISENEREIRQPVVDVWYRKGGAKVRQPYIVDLAEKSAGSSSQRRIVASVPAGGEYEIPAKYQVE